MKKKLVIAILPIIIISVAIVYFIMNFNYFFPSRNIAITSVTLPQTNIYIGTVTNITVTVKNTGTQNETFNVTAYYNTTSLGTKTVTALKSDAEISLIYIWNTSNAVPANYYMKAQCTTVPNESNTTDNTHISIIRLRYKPTHATVNMHSNPDVGFVGKNVTISINVSNIADLYRWRFKLNWTSTILEAIEIKEGSFLENQGETLFTNPTINNAAGTLQVNCTLLKDIPGATGNGTIATITFRVKATGYCFLDFQELIMLNSFEEEMNVTTSRKTLQTFSFTP